MRLFIAVQIPDNIKEKAIDIASSLKGFDGIRLVRPEHMHLTLAFLGERDDAEKIIYELERIRFNPFTLTTKGFGFFPSKDRIRVIWMGLEKSEEFFSLQRKIRTLLKHKEKFMPHITLARSREIIIGNAQLIQTALKKCIGENSFHEQSFRVEGFRLFSSELTPAGPIHTIIKSFSANGGKENETY